MPLPASVAYRELCDVEIPAPALARHWLHGRVATDVWDASRIAAHIGSGRLWLSFFEPDDEDNEDDPLSQAPVSLAGFWPEQEAFVELTRLRNNDLDPLPRYRLRIFSPRMAESCALLARMRQRFLATRPPGTDSSGPRIGLLNLSYGSLEIHRVPISGRQIVPRHDAHLYYGDTITDWIDGWIEKLNDRRYGLSILSGDPGTGKTSLLRSLAAWLATTHLFYFIPASRFSGVDSGELASFWSGENRRSSLRKVLVLEDAESILLRRSGDNREHVATLPNLTDGILGDALGLQVVCTLNSDLTDLDPALLRPGRLMTHREFTRLDLYAARRLAAHLGVSPPAGGSEEPGTFTLAELFNPSPAPPPASHRRITGFARMIE
ncbi:AAA+ family ATPase [Opitutaceae bacterium TAV1]|nr:AAA+ family ATPase [Opitutaceae bacterium TAV1]